MDQHDTKGAAPTDLAAAHSMDLALEDAYNVRFLTYWLDYARGVANCLVEAPSPEVVNEVHGLSHGLLANRVIPVNRSEVAAILGRLTDPDHGPIDEPAARLRAELARRGIDPARFVVPEFGETIRSMR